MTEAVATLVFLGALIIALEVLRRRAAVFDFLCFFNLSYLVYYSVAPLHLLLGGQDYAALPNIHDAYFADPYDYRFLFRTAQLALVAYVFTVLGYFAARNRASTTTGWAIQPISPKRIAFIALLALTLGLASFVIYLRQFDSYLTAVVEAALIRGGARDDAGTLAFLRNLVPLTALAAPVALALRLDHRKGSGYRIPGSLILLLTLLGLLALATQGSRRAWIIYVLEFYVLMANVRGTAYVGRLIGVGVVTLSVIMFGDALSVGAASGEGQMLTELKNIVTQNADALYAGLWRNFTYTYQAMVAVVARYDGLPRLLVDVPMALVGLLPERLLPVDMPAPLSAHSTLLITEIPVPLIAEVPPGFVGFFWYAGYVPGVILGTFAYGYLGGALERHLLPVAKLRAVHMLLFSYAAFCFGYFVREGIPYMIIVERFGWVFYGAALLLLGRFAMRCSMPIARPSAAGERSLARPD